MNLGVFLAIGESLTDFKKKGQFDRLIKYNLKKYSQNFDRVFIFSYSNEKFKLPRKCQLIPNDSGLHRYLYALLLPFLKKRYIKECDIMRGLQLSGGIPAIVSKIFLGRKFVINYGYDYPSFAKIEGKLFQSYLYEIIKSPILKSADAVIVTSLEIKKMVTKIVKSSKIHYIPNGVDTRLFQPSKQVSSIRKVTRIAYIGRLEKQKNLDNLVRTIPLTKMPIELTFYGAGNQKESLLHLAKNLNVPIIINDPVPYHKVPKIFAKTDIFILPSLEEGSPKILIEAMSSGKAVVGSDVRGIRELIIHGVTGIVTQTDPASIARSIVRLKDPRIRSKFGISAAKYVKQHFDLNKLLAREVNLLKKTAANI